MVADCLTTNERRNLRLDRDSAKEGPICTSFQTRSKPNLVKLQRYRCSNGHILARQRVNPRASGSLGPANPILSSHASMRCGTVDCIFTWSSVAPALGSVCAFGRNVLSAFSQSISGEPCGQPRSCHSTYARAAISSMPRVALRLHKRVASGIDTPRRVSSCARAFPSSRTV